MLLLTSVYSLASLATGNTFSQSQSIESHHSAPWAGLSENSGKKTLYCKSWHLSQKYHPPFAHSMRKIRFFLLQLVHAFPFSAFLAKLHPHMHSSLKLCCVNLSPRHPLLSQAVSSTNSNPAAAQMGKSLSATVVVSKRLGG